MNDPGELSLSLSFAEILEESDFRRLHRRRLGLGCGFAALCYRWCLGASPWPNTWRRCIVIGVGYLDVRYGIRRRWTRSYLTSLLFLGYLPSFRAGPPGPASPPDALLSA